MSRLSFLAFTLILGLFTACNSKNKAWNGGELNNTAWTLVSMPINLPSEVRVNLTFQDGRLSGRAVCNSYFAGFAMEENRLKIEAVGATKMMCLLHAEMESKYFELLSKAQRYGIQDSTLTIETPSGNLVFKATALEGKASLDPPTDPFAGEFYTDGYPDAYWQKMLIAKANDTYYIEIIASEVNGKPSCDFEGSGHLVNDTLVVPIGEPDALADMIITRRQDTLSVFTRNFDDRFAMMSYCSGGASLAGDYLVRSE